MRVATFSDMAEAKAFAKTVSNLLVITEPVIIKGKTVIHVKYK